MSVARAGEAVAIAPEPAFALWTDVARWPAFVEGFARVERLDPGWPGVGSELVWRSIPSGRGLVTERVTISEPPRRLATEVREERLTGLQTVRFDAAGTGAQIRISLDYTLAARGPVHALTDLLFIRRAQGEALARTLARFAAEARQQLAL
ncbi:MAG: hypothetical protein NVSMB25_22140 [Thermoleophilaceae bacterium]